MTLDRRNQIMAYLKKNFGIKKVWLIFGNVHFLPLPVINMQQDIIGKHEGNHIR